MTNVDEVLRKLSEREIESQEEFKEEAVHGKELQTVPEMTERDLDLTKLNDFIFRLNQPTPVETLKPDIDAARPFLQRRYFVKDGKVTLLGALVCAQHPGDRLGFRSHVHGYVDVPHQIAQDKQDFIDTVLSLMDSSLGYVLRNIHVGITAENGGTAKLQYPEELLRETLNNALAHRDYTVDKQVIIAIKPGQSLSIRNPGVFRRGLLIEDDSEPVALRRILPEAKPRNPKLANVLRVYRKWEGRGIGMATLVNLCLENQIDLPFYRIYSEEVALHLRPGKLLDEKMERLFQSFDDYIARKLSGGSLTDEQKLVLSYLIKSEWANQHLGYTILLTPDNNHFAALLGLEKAGLILKHPLSTAAYPLYIADRTLVARDYVNELRARFGSSFDELDDRSKNVLSVVYRYNNYSKTPAVSAKMASYALWFDMDASTERRDNIKEFDAFYRKVRSTFNKIEKGGFVHKAPGRTGYVLTTGGTEG